MSTDIYAFLSRPSPERISSTVIEMIRFAIDVKAGLITVRVRDFKFVNRVENRGRGSSVINRDRVASIEILVTGRKIELVSLRVYGVVL